MSTHKHDKSDEEVGVVHREFDHGDDLVQKDVIHDHDVLGRSNVTREDAMHLGELTPEELVHEKKLRKKIDCLIMPLVMLVYLMNYIDRNNYAAARLQGLQADLNLSDSQYETALSILFVGYVLMQVPSNALLNFSGKPSWYIGFWVIAWGLVSLLTSQVKNFGDIVACRFILGFVEAPFFCGVIFYLSKWYTRAELSFRMAIFYSASLLSGAFGNLIAAGILSGLAGRDGLAAWQWLYIIEGSITMAVGIVIVFVLPDFPHTWKLLSPELRFVANRRMAVDAAEADVDEPGSKQHAHGLKMAFTDPKTYIIAFMYHCVTGATGFQNFFPTLTGSLGFNNIDTLLLVAPPYMFMVFYSYGHSYASDKLRNRYWFWMYPIPITIAGCFIFMFADGFGPRYFSLFLLNFAFAMNSTIYAWIASAIPRPPAKRAAAMAFMNSVGNAASIWTPYTYNKKYNGHYDLALGVVIGLMTAAGIAGTGLRFYLAGENKRLERMDGADAELTPKDIKRLQRTAELEGIDVAAARQLQKGFRYQL
ncbi:major facilitator superfamily domain-containing protein [Neohortaea acidophila]|uniref:Major facilitator superfamily domain-containing protein n=1 Tax=Neohortaea acidophila TaxID=245834 RepID=A0A6A6Q5C4_9PEZI|nr:major facilitator superfamily domain-containing protein [Neohortaea acidophila]KAF2487492.1 major facilitator superfamily domain-containing protein [Neohortaea acidophila]